MSLAESQLNIRPPGIALVPIVVKIKNKRHFPNHFNAFSAEPHILHIYILHLYLHFLYFPKYHFEGVPGI